MSVFGLVLVLVIPLENSLDNPLVALSEVGKGNLSVHLLDFSSGVLLEVVWDLQLGPL